MRGCESAIIGAFLGGIIGPIVVTIVGWLVMSSQYPGFSTDGQSVMIVYATVPTGAVLGVVIGFCYGLWRGNRRA